ncbi:hypothetical protein CSB20_01795 [bacterium DOLZORAL124_64_63]|nr:MAG: hypothetical protein CSB20_01795 [bacterium DOLZORAL124_64_63]
MPLLIVPLLLLPLLLLLGGCEAQETPLQWQDLSPAEQTYVRRLVILERAKAVALHDRESGAAVLDSLAIAWGDSAAAEARALAPTDPTRSRLLSAYLLRVLEAEKDSLMTAPTARCLAAPIPRPTNPNDMTPNDTIPRQDKPRVSAR